MPELPEVQTTVNGLQKIINKKIYNIEVYTIKLRYIVPKKITYLVKNKKIIRIFRIAKYIIFQLSNDISLVFHLGMSGRIKLFKFINYKTTKHDHIKLNISNHNIVVFNDPRKFGFVDISKTSDLFRKKYFLKLGLDPFNKGFNKRYLSNKFVKSRSSIKQLLLNQNLVSGIGNIYACEILYDAKISPFFPGNKLNDHMIDRLIKSIKKILNKAIKSGGSTLKDYLSADGVVGNFQNKFKVYNRENEKIMGNDIKRIKQNGRSTFYCPYIQKSKYNPKL